MIAEFHANNYSVKDNVTGTFLVEGKLKEGLYQLINVSSQSNNKVLKHFYQSKKDGT